MPRTFKEVTLAISGVGGGSGQRLRGFLKMISVDLEGLSRRLLFEAQELIWLSSEGMERELLEGTIRYISSAYFLHLLPGVMGWRSEAQIMKDAGPMADP